MRNENIVYSAVDDYGNKDIEKMVNLYIYEDYSLRKLAEVYGVSHYTVKNIMLKCRDFNLDLYDKLMESFSEKKEKTLKDESVRIRVLSAVKILLADDKTVKEIADILGSTEFTIYRDLTVRFPKINKYIESKLSDEYFILVKERLRKHSIDNNQRGMSK